MAKKYGTTKKKHGKVGKIFSFFGFVLLCAVFGVLLVNSLLSIFKEDYYTSFGGNRFFAIVTDSMEGEIPTGSLIVSKVPQSQEEITENTVITYKVKQGKSTVLITHRVVKINTEGEKVSYTTKGDNAPGEDGTQPTFQDIVGIYSGKKIDKLGYVVGFSQSREGAIALIIILFIIVFTDIVVSYLGKVNVLREDAVTALRNVKEELKVAGGGQVDIINTIINVHDPKDKKSYKRSIVHLENYVYEHTADDSEDEYDDEPHKKNPKHDSGGYGQSGGYSGYSSGGGYGQNGYGSTYGDSGYNSGSTYGSNDNYGSSGYSDSGYGSGGYSDSNYGSGYGSSGYGDSGYSSGYSDNSYGSGYGGDSSYGNNDSYDSYGGGSYSGYNDDDDSPSGGGKY